MEPPSSPCPTSRRSQRDTPETTSIPSSPTSRRSDLNKKPPSITPRRFTRFFTPRSSQQSAQSARVSRIALGDVGIAGGNRRLAHSSPIKQSQRLFDEDENGFSDPFESTPERPSPLKRVCTVHPRDFTAEIPPLSSQEIPSSPPPCPDTPTTHQPAPNPLIKSAFRKRYGLSVRREVDWAMSTTRRSRAGLCSTNIQSETAHFYSSELDFHHTYNIDSYLGSDPNTTPFCIAPCNTNSLAAIADEEGYIRLIETAKGKDPPLRKHYLHFRAHKNAILHAEFSEDDALLATAAGDQTGQVIDMKTQKALFTLWGHRSSLRQVKFQPGSGGKVLATAGRDGLIMIWDLRCTPTERPHPITPAMNLGGGITTWDPNKDRRYAQHIHQFMPQIPRNKDGKVPSEKSVTALSFISSSDPHCLLSGSATGASVSLWDMRKMRLSALSGQNALVGKASPSNSSHNSRGLLSMALSGDKSRIYALSRDSTAYVYSTAQVLNEGSNAEALYGFRHRDMIVTTWYHSLALRPARHDKTELLGVAGVGGRALLFPTNEDYFSNEVVESSDYRTGVKIYDNGTVLNHGHTAEVSSVAWTSNGEFCTASDDLKCRVWREDAEEARQIRANSRANNGERDLRWCGWADVAETYDDDNVFLDDC